jgi:hypothetical protein
MTQQTLLAAVAAAAAQPVRALKEDVDSATESSGADERQEQTDMDENEISAAVKAERERILAIQAVAFPGQEKLASDMIANGVSAGEAAMAFNADQKAKLSAVLKNFEADEEKVNGLRSEYSTANKPAANDAFGHLSGEQKWKAEYAADDNLRQEFEREADYVAFKKADARGALRILKK